MILSFRTDMPGQTVQAQIRSRSSLIRVHTVCHSVCIVWTHYSMVEPHSSDFKVITTNFSGVRIFRKFTVMHRLRYTGRGSSVRSASTWYGDSCRLDPHVRQHSFVEFGHEIISMAILSLLLIQEGQLSVTGERMCTDYW